VLREVCAQARIELVKLRRGQSHYLEARCGGFECSLLDLPVQVYDPLLCRLRPSVAKVHSKGLSREAGGGTGPTADVVGGLDGRSGSGRQRKQCRVGGDAGQVGHLISSIGTLRSTCIHYSFSRPGLGAVLLAVSQEATIRLAPV
jgi:hypothetical protein